MDILPGEQEQAAIDYPYDYDPSLNGIGGWLILIIIGRILSIISGIKNIFDMSVYLGYDPRLDIVAYSSIAINALVVVILSGLVLYLIFTRKIIFRVFLVLEAAVVIIYDLFLIIYTSSLGAKPDIFYLIIDLLAGAIWIPYFFLSKRIKNTFIYRNYIHIGMKI